MGDLCLCVCVWVGDLGEGVKWGEATRPHSNPDPLTDILVVSGVSLPSHLNLQNIHRIETPMLLSGMTHTYAVTFYVNFIIIFAHNNVIEVARQQYFI